ncbi:hypothetical protein AAID93_09005 [Campylobacter coli]
MGKSLKEELKEELKESDTYKENSAHFDIKKPNEKIINKNINELKDNSIIADFEHNIKNKRIIQESYEHLLVFFLGGKIRRYLWFGFIFVLYLGSRINITNFGNSYYLDTIQAILRISLEFFTLVFLVIIFFPVSNALRTFFVDRFSNKKD